MALVYVVHLLGRGQLGPEQAEAWREARVEDHRRAPLQLHPAVRRGHRRLDLGPEQAQLRDVHVVDGHLGGGGAAGRDALVRVRVRVRVRARVRVRG